MIHNVFPISFHKTDTLSCVPPYYSCVQQSIQRRSRGWSRSRGWKSLSSKSPTSVVQVQQQSNEDKDIESKGIVEESPVDVVLEGNRVETTIETESSSSKVVTDQSLEEMDAEVVDTLEELGQASTFIPISPASTIGEDDHLKHDAINESVSIEDDHLKHAAINESVSICLDTKFFDTQAKQFDDFEMESRNDHSKDGTSSPSLPSIEVEDAGNSSKIHASVVPLAQAFQPSKPLPDDFNLEAYLFPKIKKETKPHPSTVTVEMMKKMTCRTKRGTGTRLDKFLCSEFSQDSLTTKQIKLLLVDLNRSIQHENEIDFQQRKQLFKKSLEALAKSPIKNKKKAKGKHEDESRIATTVSLNKDANIQILRFDESMDPQDLTDEHIDLLVASLQKVGHYHQPSRIFHLIKDDSEDSIVLGRDLLKLEHDIGQAKRKLSLLETEREEHSKELNSKITKNIEKMEKCQERIDYLEDEIDQVELWWKKANRRRVPRWLVRVVDFSELRRVMKLYADHGMRIEFHEHNDEEVDLKEWIKKKVTKKGKGKTKHAINDDNIELAEAEGRKAFVRAMVKAESGLVYNNVRVTADDKDLLTNDLQKELDEQMIVKTELSQIIPIFEAQSSLKDSLVENQRAEIEAIRVEITKIKGEGEEEDDHHDINRSIDELGHNFLTVAVLRNDIRTAKLCLTLGADPEFGEQVTALLIASYFNRTQFVSLFTDHGGQDPIQNKAWRNILQDQCVASNHRMDWEMVQKIADVAAQPSHDLMKRASQLDNDEDKRMPNCKTHQSLNCFDASLTDPNVNSSSLRRTVLLERDVYRWFLDTKTALQESLVDFIFSLLPEDQGHGLPASREFHCHREAVVGIIMRYKVHAVKLDDLHTVLFTPFVTNEVDGVTSVGVLLWTISEENEISLYKTLIESTEFLRAKVDADDHFPDHIPNVLELGKNMHLLDLRSTSIHDSHPLELYAISIDEGELEKMGDEEFTPKRRVLEYEDRISRAIFRTSETEAQSDQKLLSDALGNLSTNLHGGAGSGKTHLMTKKIISISSTQRILVVTRLPRLLSAIKSMVQEGRNIENVTFKVYDDLLSELARSTPTPEAKSRQFRPFSQVLYGDMRSTGGEDGLTRTREDGHGTKREFLQDFVLDYLSEQDRKKMKALRLEPLTLYAAFRTIKSSVLCLEQLEPLTLAQYLNLPQTAGLDKSQRELVFSLYENRYKEWLRHEAFKWDEADRVLHILRCGNKVFSSSKFCSWRRHYNLGQGDSVSDENGSPIAPFFYDRIFVDEAQVSHCQQQSLPCICF